MGEGSGFFDSWVINNFVLYLWKEKCNDGWFQMPHEFCFEKLCLMYQHQTSLLIFFVIEMNVAPLVVMIDYMIIVATPFFKIKWGNLMASTKEGQAIMNKLGYMHFVWQNGGKWKLMEEEITLSKSMWYVYCLLHESSSYLKLVKILRKQKKLCTHFLVVKFSIY